ncbi:MAG: DUF177 domain-containing protein [Lentimicrobiaceae bacterium]|jgi:uncharacterized metal-binding protein YceD (DUF177 family)|nr:DUF177 domain-containing protein [Lentimicrobiaceae bacterium]
MDYINGFVVQFSGLSLGLHPFDFEIDQRFFDQIEYSEIRNGNIKVHLDFDKHERMFILDFHISGEIEVICNRCAELFAYPIQGKERLIVKIGETTPENTEEDILIISETEYKLDLSGLLYEYISLMLPFRVVHPEDEYGNSKCNPEMIKKIEEMAPRQQPDPRWDSLKKLINNEQENNN